MQIRTLGTKLSALLLFLVPAFAQSPAQLVKEALSADQNGANAEQSISLYRQAIAAPSDQHVYAAFAQYRISQLLLQKGKLTEAAAEFAKLGQNYPDCSDLISTLVAEDRVDVFHGSAGPPSPARLPISQSGAKGMYRHARTGVEFNPQGWKIRGEFPSSGDGQMVMLTDEASNAQVMLWLKPDQLLSADIAGRLRGALQQKILQRLDLEGYRIRPESIQSHTIGGKQALSAVADFTADGQPMTELLTWIYTENTRVLFFTRLPVSQITDFKVRFDNLVGTAVFPQSKVAE